MSNPNWNELVYYDTTSPSCLRWNVDLYKSCKYSVKCVSVGDVAGSKTPEGYWTVTFSRKAYRCHRIILELHGIAVNGVVDHIDGNPSNNAFENLRVCDHKVNRRNARKSARNTSGTTGVSYMSKQTGKGVLEYWVAYWRDLTGKLKGKTFSILKLGNDEAYRLACMYRKDRIDELNAYGAGYTERHGMT